MIKRLKAHWFVPAIVAAFGLAAGLHFAGFQFRRGSRAAGPPAVKAGDHGHHVVILHCPEQSLPKEMTFMEHPAGVWRTEIRIRDKDEHDAAVRRVFGLAHGWDDLTPSP